MADSIHFGSGHLYQVWSIGDGQARFDYFRNGLTGHEMYLERYEPFVILAVDEGSYSVASEIPDEHRASDFALEDVGRQVEGENFLLTLTYRSNIFRALVTYEHRNGSDWIRKRVHLENLGPPLHIVGISLQDWELREDSGRFESLDCGYRFAFPGYGTSRRPDQAMTRLGMPAIAWGRSGGLIAGIEFPGSHTDVSDNAYRCDYRPGVLLDTGESLDSEPAVVLAFSGDDFLSARDAFVNYLTEAYPPRIPSPARFNTVGSWLEQATEERVLATLPLAKEMGIEVYVLDFGWSHYDGFPFSFGKPKDPPPVEQVEQGFWRRELFPDGLDGIKEQADRLGIRLGLHYETSGFPHIEEVTDWELKGTINEGYCLCTGYGNQFEQLVLYQVERYGLGEIKLDFFTQEPCVASGHDHRSDGYDSSDKQVIKILELMRRARELQPDLVISLFTGGGYTSPWWLRYADQLHSGDPGHNVMFRAMLEDNTKSQAMALERRDRWHWATGQGMRPAHCVQVDVHGYGIQATGSSAAHIDREQDDSIPLGAGWQQTLFSCLALTQVRDVKINPWYLSGEDRAFVARWLQWGRENAERLIHPRSLFGAPTGIDIEGYVHANSDEGHIFLFNPSPEPAHVEINLSELFGPGHWSITCLYPVKEPWGSQSLAVTVAPKDCLVLEVSSSSAPVGDGEKNAASYTRTAARVQKPFQPVVTPAWPQLFKALTGRQLRFSEESRARYPWDERLHRRAVRLLDAASVGGASIERADTADSIEVDIHTHPQAITPVDDVGGFEDAFGATLWRLPSGALIDGAVVVGFPTGGELTRLSLAATAPEHFVRALDRGEQALFKHRDLRLVEVLDDASRYEVTTSGEGASPVSPLHSRSVRFVSAYAEERGFGLADAVMGSSVKLGKPASRRRGFLFQPGPGGEVAARVSVLLPSADQVLLRFGVGIVDQMAPSWGVNLANRSSGARFVLDLEGEEGTTKALDEPVFPELYPSWEMLEYPQLLPESLHNDFLRPVLLDVSRWAGKEVRLALRVIVDDQYHNLHCLPLWTPPQILSPPRDLTTSAVL